MLPCIPKIICHMMTAFTGGRALQLATMKASQEETSGQRAPDGGLARSFPKGLRIHDPSS